MLNKYFGIFVFCFVGLLSLGLLSLGAFVFGAFVSWGFCLWGFHPWGFCPWGFCTWGFRPAFPLGYGNDIQNRRISGSENLNTSSLPAVHIIVAPWDNNMHTGTTESCRFPNPNRSKSYSFYNIRNETHAWNSTQMTKYSEVKANCISLHANPSILFQEFENIQSVTGNM